MGVNHYNIRNPCRQLPKIYHEFSKQSLRYKLNVVLNETDSNLISKAETTSLYQFKLLIKSNLINKYKDQGWGQVQYLYLVLVLKYIFIST